MRKVRVMVLDTDSGQSQALFYYFNHLGEYHMEHADDGMSTMYTSDYCDVWDVYVKDTESVYEILKNKTVDILYVESSLDDGTEKFRDAVNNVLENSLFVVPVQYFG